MTITTITHFSFEGKLFCEWEEVTYQEAIEILDSSMLVEVNIN